MLDKSLRIKELDGIRGTAILIVLIFHWIVSEGGSGFLPASINNLGRFGWSGVDLFFVLSGFLITGILIDAKDSKHYFKVFYIRRFCRILPLYLLVLGLSIVLYNSNLANSSLGQDSHEWLFGNMISWGLYFIFAQNFAMTIESSMGSKVIGATWSLAVEEQFYLTFPFIIRFVKEKYLPYIFLAGIIFAPIVRIGLYFALDPYQSNIGNYVLPFCRMDALCIGALGAWFIRKSHKEQDLQKLSPYAVYLISLILFAGVFVLANVNLEVDSFLLISIGYTWIALFYFSICWIALTIKESLIAQFFRLRVLSFLGTLSYGLYLLHQPVLGIVHGVTRQSSPLITERFAYLVTFLALGCLLILAYFSWIYFEKPLVRLGRNYKY